MSINAIEVLEARFANREKFVGRGRLHETELETESGFDDPKRTVFHSVKWWDDQWEKHQQWVDRVYPAPAVTGYEVTPVTGVPLAD